MMTGSSLQMIGAIAATFIVAGIVKGVTGMGLPTVAMGILGGLISPLAAASLLIIPSFATNIWQLLAGPNFYAVIRKLWLMMLAMVVGTIAGSRLLVSGNTGFTTSALGAVLVIYAVYTLFARQQRIAPWMEPWLSPVIGMITGIVTGSTGVFVVPAVPYLQALGFEKEAFIQALGLSFTISTIAMAAGLAWHGAFHAGNLATSGLAIIPSLIGMWAGQSIRDRISPRLFRRGFLIFLMLIGGEMLLRPFL